VSAKTAVVTANPNTLSNRAAMGLPESFVDRAGADPLARHRDLGRADPDDLAAMLEDARTDFPRRHACGTMLALVGDPRILPEDPEMVPVPGARVVLGLDPAGVHEVTDRWRHTGVQESWIVKECPSYSMRIEPFRIARYPVTNAEYRRLLEDTDEPRIPTSWRFGAYPAHRSNHPVWTVSPDSADAYAAWLADRTGRTFRLPTEAEWEYVASGGDGREFPWGDEPGADTANTVETGPLTTTAVGTYPRGRSPFGVDDMGGNVEEFVADDYRPYPGGARVDDDLLRITGTYRIARGGSFTRFADLARCRRRHGWYDRDIYAIGFRLAESL
jgi:formylglycine-generating enzyme required for sulfatase activity